MKTTLFIILSLIFSLSAQADAVEDFLFLNKCGGEIQVRSYSNEAGEKTYYLRLKGVQCEFIKLYTGPKEKQLIGEWRLDVRKDVFDMALPEQAVAALENKGLGFRVYDSFHSRRGGDGSYLKIKESAYTDQWYR